MVQQVTQGIKISIETNFEGSTHQNCRLHFAFAYQITIKNQGKDPVQLLSRFWKIKDALHETLTVEGEGVIGRKPIIKPGETHTYKSGCLLTSPLGAMSGFFKMINFSSARKFKVTIPSFKLSAPFALN